MLNYIWAGLIVASLLFALYADGRDLAQDTYRNGQALPVEVDFPDGYDAEARTQPAAITVRPAAFAAHYGVDAPGDSAFTGTLIQTERGRILRWDAEAALPAPLDAVRDATNPRDLQLQGTLDGLAFAAPPPGGGGPQGRRGSAPDTAADTTATDTAAAATAPAAPPPATARVTFEPVRFLKLQAISAAALEFAETAAGIAIGLIGVLALFLGLLKIAEAAGVINALARIAAPVLRPLFPDVPKDHPAFSLIVLNLSANIFGLGNAATPFGIKAMEELQTLNPSEDTATDAMVTLLVMNTASVQLVPPVLLLALLGTQVNALVVPILLATAISLIVALVLVRLFARLPRFRRTNPNRLAPPPAPDAA